MMKHASMGLGRSQMPSHNRFRKCTSGSSDQKRPAVRWSRRYSRSFSSAGTAAAISRPSADAPLRTQMGFPSKAARTSVSRSAGTAAGAAASPSSNRCLRRVRSSAFEPDIATAKEAFARFALTVCSMRQGTGSRSGTECPGKETAASAGANSSSRVETNATGYASSSARHNSRWVSSAKPGNTTTRRSRRSGNSSWRWCGSPGTSISGYPAHQQVCGCGPGGLLRSVP